MERKYGQLPNRVEFMQDVHIETADVDIEVQFNLVEIEVGDFDAYAKIVIDEDVMDELTDVQLLWLEHHANKRLQKGGE